MNILLWMMASSYFWFRERLSHSYERGNLNVLFSNNMLGVNIKSLAFRVLCIFYLSNTHITYSFSWLFDTQNVRVWQREITEKKTIFICIFQVVIKHTECHTSRAAAEKKTIISKTRSNHYSNVKQSACSFFSCFLVGKGLSLECGGCCFSLSLPSFKSTSLLLWLMSALKKKTKMLWLQHHAVTSNVVHHWIVTK